MRILPPESRAEAVFQQPIAGLDRYRHLTDRALVGELVRRSIVGSRDDVDLRALAPQWRPVILRTILAFHDQFPNGLWLPGGIRAGHFGGAEPGRTMAYYLSGERSITINADSYSKNEVKRAQWRGNLAEVQNHLAGTIFHECWHCVQDAYTPAMKEYIADRLEALTGSRFPLAVGELRAHIRNAIRPYAVTLYVEFEAELMRTHMQGQQTLLSVAFASAADALFGPDAPASTLDRAKELFAENLERRARGESTLDPYVPPPKAEVAPGLLGTVHEEPAYLSGSDSWNVHYIETTDGMVYRLVGSTLINVTQSFDDRALVAYEIPRELQERFSFDVGQPMWFQRTRSDAALPEGFAPAPVARVVSVPRGLYRRSAEEVAQDTHGRRTDLVRRAEQMLAAVDPRSIGMSPEEAGVAPELTARYGPLAQPEYLRCHAVPDGAIQVSALGSYPYSAAIVATAPDGLQFALSRDAFDRCSITVMQHDGESTWLGYVSPAESGSSMPDLRVGTTFTCTNFDGAEFSFGPIERLVVAEQLPFAHDALQAMRPSADRVAPARAPAAVAATER